MAVVSRHSGRAPSECLAERNLFRIVAGSGIAEFIYLGMLITNYSSVEKEILRRILAGNRTYFAAISLFRNLFLSLATKILLCI
jgi:alpha-galactosidase